MFLFRYTYIYIYICIYIYIYVGAWDWKVEYFLGNMFIGANCMYVFVCAALHILFAGALTLLCHARSPE